jgi:hypothetical protein
MATRDLFAFDLGSSGQPCDNSTLSNITNTWGYRWATANAGDALFFVGAIAAGVIQNIYKNQGWYAAGSAFEEWVTSGAPSTVPPSGHTLSDISFVVLQQ